MPSSLISNTIMILSLPFLSLACFLCMIWQDFCFLTLPWSFNLKPGRNRFVINHLEYNKKNERERSEIWFKWQPKCYFSAKQKQLFITAVFNLKWGIRSALCPLCGPLILVAVGEWQRSNSSLFRTSCGSAIEEAIYCKWQILLLFREIYSIYIYRVCGH